MTWSTAPTVKSAMFLGAQAFAKKQIAAEARRQAGASPVGAGAAVPARPRLFGVLLHKGWPGHAHQAHASELGRHGICVNGVAPTVLRTEMGAHWLKDPKTAAWLKERIPLGRVANPGIAFGATSVLLLACLRIALPARSCTSTGASRLPNSRVS